MPFTLDVEFLPLYVITHVGSVSDDDFAKHLTNVERTMYGPNAGKRILIHDATLAGPTSAKQRRLQADWLKAHEAKLRELAIASVFVIPSTFVRGVLTAILWLQPLPMPHHICGTLAEAIDWAETRAREEGLRVPQNARGALLARQLRHETEGKTGTLG